MPSRSGNRAICKNWNWVQSRGRALYGHTVSLIGESLRIAIAREAVEMLLRGSGHKTVYRFLERKRADIRAYEMGFEQKVHDAAVHVIPCAVNLGREVLALRGQAPHPAPNA